MKDTDTNRPNQNTRDAVCLARQRITRIERILNALEADAKANRADWGTAGTANKAAADLEEIARFLT